MKCLNILTFLLCFFILNSCGFKKLNSEINSNFYINNIEIKGDKRLAASLKNNILIYSQNNSKYKYDAVLNLKFTKESKIKDSAGKTIRYTNKLSLELELVNVETKQKFNKLFVTSSDYDIASTNSATLKNEKNIINNNLNYISDEIVKYIRLLNVS